MRIARRSRKSPARYTNQQGEIFRCNQFKNLTYENMERFINALPNNETYMEQYNILRYSLSAVHRSPYTLVRKWFIQQFPEFRTNPVIYMTITVAVLDASAFAEAQATA